VEFWRNKTLIFSEIMLGATGGAAGWIIGAQQNLVAAGRSADAAVVLWCAVAVFMIGGILWLLWLAGCRFNMLLIVNLLLGASIIFGALALWIMHARGVLALAIDPSGRYPEWLAWAAPVILLVMMAATWCPPTRRWLMGSGS
jgi:hypothetical protein